MSPNDLRKAIKQGDLDKAKAIMKVGGAGWVYKQGWSALHLACKAGQVEIVRALLECQPDVNAMTDLWRTPLDESLRHRQTAITSLVRDAGGKFAHELSLAGALASNNLRWVKKNLAAGADLNQKIIGQLPVCIALKHSSEEVLNYFLRKKPDVQKTQGPGDTPLHVAIESNPTKATLVTLLRLGADINAINDDGITPLGVAAYMGDPEAIRFLIKHGAKPKLRVRGWANPVTMALDQDNHEIARLLIDHGGEADLFQAVHCGHLGQVQRLVREGADLEATGSWRNVTSLQLAVQKDHPEVVEYLLDSKAEPNVQETFRFGSDSPLHDAVTLSSARMVKALLAHGADPDMQNQQGLTPLELAKRRNFGHLVHIMESHLDRQFQLKAVEQLYTVHKVTELLSVDEAFVAGLVKSGKLRQVYLDRQTPRIPESSLGRYISSLNSK